MSMSCLDCHDYMDGYNRGKREGTKEELVKIKEELEKIIRFEEEWLIDIKINNGFISIADIETAMNAIRFAVSGKKGDK